MQGRSIPFALGALLIIASVLKVMSLLEYAPQPGIKEGVFEWAVIAGETGLALWLWSGKYAKASAKTALACFCGFALVNLWKITLGVENCGCFGPWLMSPTSGYWIDVAAILCGLFSPGMTVHQRRFRPSIALVAAVTTASLILWAGGIVSAGHVSKTDPQDGGVPPRTGTKWPNPGEIDSSADFSHGKWVVLLYRASCGRCRWAVEDLLEQAKVWRSQRKGLRVALVDTQGDGCFGDLQLPREIQAGRYKLPQGFGLSPVVLFLENGHVQSALEFSKGIQWGSSPAATARD